MIARALLFTSLAFSQVPFAGSLDVPSVVVRVKDHKGNPIRGTSLEMSFSVETFKWDTGKEILWIPGYIRESPRAPVYADTNESGLARTLDQVLLVEDDARSPMVKLEVSQDRIIPVVDYESCKVPQSYFLKSSWRGPRGTYLNGCVDVASGKDEIASLALREYECIVSPRKAESIEAALELWKQECDMQ